MADFGRELLACAVDGAGTDGQNPLRHVADLPSRPGRRHAWPQWADPDVVQAFVDRGIEVPWSHQFTAADLAHDGRHVVLSTGTASGKSVAYQLPILTALRDNPRSRALYLSPTKALGHDQLRAATALTEAVPALRDVAPSSYDGDSPADVRRFARERSRWIFSNPDMIHLSLLRNHARWAMFLRNLQYIVVDECHYYRGIFGSNVAMVLRRLLRLSDTVLGHRRQPNWADGHLRQRHHRIACGHRLGADRADRRGGHRGRIAAGRTHGRAVGTGTAGRYRRRKRRSRTAFRGRGGGACDGESDCGRCPHVDVRALSPRCRTHRTRCAGTTGGARSGSRRPGGVLPGGLSGRGPPRIGTRAGRRAIAGAGDNQRAGARRGHRRPGRRGAGGVPRYGDVILAAGRSCGPPRPERADRIDRPRRPTGHVSGPSPRGAVGQADRACRHRPVQSVCPWTTTSLRGDRTAPHRCGGADVERRGGRGVTRRRRFVAATIQRLLRHPRRGSTSGSGHTWLIGWSDRDPRGGHRSDTGKCGRRPGAGIGSSRRRLSASG